MIAKIIDGLSVAAGIQELVKVQVESLARKGVKPCLCTILVGENPSSITYINKKQKAAHDVDNPVEFLNQRNARENEQGTHDQGAENAPEQHLMLVQIGDTKIAEDH